MRLGDDGADLEGRPQPRVDRGPERRHLGQGGDGVRDPRDVGVGQVAPEVGGLHRAGPAAGGDHEVRAEGVPEPGGVDVLRIAAVRRVAAHHADQVLALDPPRERLVDRVVVQRASQRVVGAAAGLGPGEGPGVQRALVRRDVVQLLGGVEARPVDVHRRDRQRAAAPARPRPRSAPRRPSRRCSRGTSLRRPAAGQVLATLARSTPATRQPLSRVAPAATLRSKSASDSTRTTRPRLRLTAARLVPARAAEVSTLFASSQAHSRTLTQPPSIAPSSFLGGCDQNACAISSPNSACSSTSRPRAWNHAQMLAQSRWRKSMPLRLPTRSTICGRSMMTSRSPAARML